MLENQASTRITPNTYRLLFPYCASLPFVLLEIISVGGVRSCEAAAPILSTLPCSLIAISCSGSRAEERRANTRRGANPKQESTYSAKGRELFILWGHGPQARCTRHPGSPKVSFFTFRNQRRKKHYVPRETTEQKVQHTVFTFVKFLHSIRDQTTEITLLFTEKLKSVKT